MKSLKIILNIWCALLFTFALSKAHSETLKEYQARSALDKQTISWAKILENPYEMYPETKTGLGIGFLLSSLGSLATLNTSFDHASDEMPKARQKIIHPFGVTAPIHWVPLKNKYTGVFQSGGLGLARLSIAGDPSLLGFVPGMAVKIFIDGKPSVNLQVMHSLDGQGQDENFFKFPFTNNIPKPDSILLQPLILLFSAVQNPPTYLPINHFADINKKGIQPKKSNTPFALVFKPTEEVQEFYSEFSILEDFRFRLESLPQGISLYDIYAQDSEGSDLELIGSMKLKKSFVASFYQDQKLFFQHNR